MKTRRGVTFSIRKCSACVKTNITRKDILDCEELVLVFLRFRNPQSVLQKSKKITISIKLNNYFQMVTMHVP